MIPLAMWGLMAQGASSGMNNLANDAVIKKQAQRRKEEDVRQAAYRARAESALAKVMTKFGRDQQDADIAGRGANREGIMQSAAQLRPDQTEVGEWGDEPENVRTAMAQRIADAMAKGKEQIKAQAALGAYADSQLDNQRTLNTGAEEIGQMADFAGGSSGVFADEMQHAQRAGDQYRRVADLFRAGGSALTMYSMMNNQLPKTTPTTMQSPGGYTLNIG